MLLREGQIQPRDSKQEQMTYEVQQITEEVGHRSLGSKQQQLSIVPWRCFRELERLELAHSWFTQWCTFFSLLAAIGN